MFLVGVLFQKNCERLLPWFGGRWLPALVGYCVLAGLGTSLLKLNVGNTLGLPLFLALAVATFATAFSRPQLSDRLLRRNDISYGVYIYHMPAVNLLIALGLAGSAIGFPVALCMTLACAGLSWRLVEKPACDGRSIRSTHMSTLPPGSCYSQPRLNPVRPACAGPTAEVEAASARSAPVEPCGSSGESG